MAKHIVIGAGLGGLYTVARLINEGVASEHIIVIDPRAGQYTRPGHLIAELFSLFHQKTNIKTDNYSSAHHIKELERMMYAYLDSNHVQFIKEPFIALQKQTPDQSKAVITEKDDGSQGIYPADFVFDCTGKSAYVAQAVNHHLQQEGLEAFFYYSLLTDITLATDHLVAQVLIANNDQLLNFLPFLTTSKHAEPRDYRTASTEKNIETREQLRALGWPYETFPSFYTYPQKDSHKVCLYMETPPDLAVERQPAWIKLLLRIYSNGKINEYTELKPSQKYGTKPRIMGFKSTPYWLDRAVFQANDLPTVIVGFDALKGSDYRRGNGITSGVECCELMLRNFTINDGSIQNIDITTMEQDIFNYINNTHKKSLDYILKPRQKAIEKGYSYFSDIYAKAAKELPPSELVKKQKYQSIAGDLAYQAAVLQFQAFTEGRDINIETLNKCVGLFLRASQNMPAHQTQAHHDNNNKLQLTINKLRLAIMAINIDNELENIKNHSLLLTIFESINANFQQLDGSFASKAIQQKSVAIIEKINQKQDVINQSKNPSGFGEQNDSVPMGRSFAAASSSVPDSTSDTSEDEHDSYTSEDSDSDVSSYSDFSSDNDSDEDNSLTGSYTLK